MNKIKSLQSQLPVCSAVTVQVGPSAKPAHQLTQLKGIGAQIATVLAREVFYRRFESRRSLGSYLGLTLSPFHSGSMDHDQGISKAGNPRARTTSI
ncbi:MAG: IS110 family transposase [Mesorhizobium sp.]|nr:MAG: IS110 family transposase [Mesorhizobium sp.]